MTFFPQLELIQFRLPVVYQFHMPMSTLQKCLYIEYDLVVLNEFTEEASAGAKIKSYRVGLVLRTFWASWWRFYTVWLLNKHFSNLKLDKVGIDYWQEDPGKATINVLWSRTTISIAMYKVCGPVYHESAQFKE